MLIWVLYLLTLLHWHLHSPQHNLVQLEHLKSKFLRFLVAALPGTRFQTNIRIYFSNLTRSLRPPNGCLQYFTTPTGRITTFNFLSTTSSKLDSQMWVGLHGFFECWSCFVEKISFQRYNACIRQQAGFCCTQYIQCQNVPNSFTIDTIAAVIGAVDTACITDYVTIPGI